MVIEKTVRFATTVEDLPAAWAFIMSHIDQVGPAPTIRISPIWSIGDDREQTMYFEAMVEGMVEEE